VTSTPEDDAVLRRALHVEGFVYMGRNEANWLRFDGTVTAADSSFKVEVLVDPLGISVPKVRLKDFPSNGLLTPHLARGELCYLAGHSVVLDVFNRASQVLACIRRAELTIARILQGGLEDVADEFFAYWGPSAAELIDAPSSEARQCKTWMFGCGTVKQLVFTSDVDRTAKKLRSLGLLPLTELNPAIIVHTNVQPTAASRNWPPTTVDGFLNWQTGLDRSCAKQLRKALERARLRKQSNVTCIICSPRLLYGARVHLEYPPAYRKGQRRARYDRKKLQTKSRATPFNLVRIDDKYLTTRSTPQKPTLAGLRVMLLGCGTVGGFLAELLVKAGAGTGGGHLALVDPDKLAPENVGRHRLGFDYVFQNKAEALAKELRRGAPTSEIDGRCARGQDVELSGLDLLVDATGEEALGHWLAWRLTGAFVPTLSVWVEGPGIAVRALLRDSEEAACLRCLNGVGRDALHPVTVEPIPLELAGHGCESLYVPFPVTVSVHAATLAAELATDWVAQAPSPRLRTRIIAPRVTLGTADTDPGKVLGCLACSARRRGNP
jgi:hypothetical protein